MLNYPKISVIIPVKNEAKYIKDCIAGILSQTIPAHEIIVIDSGSTDGTQEIAKSYSKVKLVQIKSEEFNHGQTRNLGVDLSTGDFVLFTVGDARPVGEDWIKSLLEGFKDESVAGVCGSQVVERRNGTNPAEWYKPQSKPTLKRYRFENVDEFEKSTPEEKHSACSWDDVSAMYRKKAIEEIPFRRIVYGEDILWAIDALKAGYTLVYNPAAIVYHFHLNDYQTILKRTIAVSYLRFSAFGFLSGNYDALRTIARNLYRIYKVPELTWLDKWYWTKYNLTAIWAQKTGLSMFKTALKSGAGALDELHGKYCGTPPLPIKKTP